MRSLPIFLFFYAMCLLVSAQQVNENPPKEDEEAKSSGIRAFLGKFTLSLSSGYGATFYSHDVTGVGLIQKTSDSLFLFDNTFIISNDTINVGYNNWFNNPQSHQNIPVNPSDYQLGTDTSQVTYKARGGGVPIDISVHYTFDRYRFGLGYAFEIQHVGEFKPQQFKNNLLPFKPDFTVTSFKRFYLMFGGEFFRTLRHTFAADVHVGRYNLGKKHFNSAAIQKGLFFNLGVDYEFSLSEYVRVFLRPSYEFKNYTITIPETSFSIPNSLPAFYVNFGLRLKLPELHKCPISNCRTQMDHVHNGYKYRSRVHPFWKWQNPNYGQNYRRLIKYKGKNKRRLNPY